MLEHTPNTKTRLPKLSVTITPELLAQVDDLVQQHGPFAKRHSIHVIALKLGLAELVAHPNRLLEALGHQG